MAINLNMGYVAGDGSVELGYTGNWTGLQYLFTDHGVAEPNSIMDGQQFDTTGTVRLGIASDFDPNKVIFNWQMFSDQQLWRTDINTLETAVEVVSEVDTTDSATLDYMVESSGATGSFTATVEIKILPSIGVRALTLAGQTVTLTLGHMLSLGPRNLTVQGAVIGLDLSWAGSITPRQLNMEGMELRGFALSIVTPRTRTLSINAVDRILAIR